MKIVVPRYLVDLKTISSITKEALEPYKDVVISDAPVDDPCWLLSWGVQKYGAKSAVLETGFFWEAAHIDTIGAYKYSAFNTPEGIKKVEEFTPPYSIVDRILQQPRPSKYAQVNKDIKWEGIVLALQNPGDRSVYSVASTKDYLDFVEGACKYYGKRLFLKAHPWNSGEWWTILSGIASRYGVPIEKCNHSVVEHCEGVLVFNSSFVVDCFVRGIPVAQYAPGYFYQTPAVYYTHGAFPDRIGWIPTDWGKQLVEFLAWKYCFDYTMPADDWVKMMKCFSESNEMFPLPDIFSYAHRRLNGEPCQTAI